MKTTNYFIKDYEITIDRALLNGIRIVDIIIPISTSTSADKILEIYRAANRYLTRKEVKYDFYTNLEIRVLKNNSLV